MTHYHPRRKDKEIVDRAEFDRILRGGKYAVVGMANGDDPYVVTLSYGYDAESGAMYFHGAKKGEKVDRLERNPKVCATVIEDRGYIDGGCSHAFATLVIRGEMKIVTELEEKKRALVVILGHLERDPAPILARNITSDASYDAVTIMRLQPSDISGKVSAG